MGYLLMLIAMTYALPMLFSVVLGISIGHYYTLAKYGVDYVSGGDPCCSEDGQITREVTLIDH